MSFKNFVAATALAMTAFTSAATAATITIRDVGGTFAYGSISYAGADSDILGWYDGAWTETLAERYSGGNNGAESALVGSIIGDPTLNLGSTELPITDSSALVPGNSYFTAKFGQSLGVFHNTTDSAITVSFSKDDSCSDNKKKSESNQCGGISHYKHTSDGTYMTPVPLPAAGWLLIAGLGGLFALRRRSTA